MQACLAFDSVLISFSKASVVFRLPLGCRWRTMQPFGSSVFTQQQMHTCTSEHRLLLRSMHSATAPRSLLTCSGLNGACPQQQQQHPALPPLLGGQHSRRCFRSAATRSSSSRTDSSRSSSWNISRGMLLPTSSTVAACQHHLPHRHQHWSATGRLDPAAAAAAAVICRSFRSSSSSSGFGGGGGGGGLNIKKSSKVKTVYVCRECGAEHLQSWGKCPKCGNWGCLEEQQQAPAGADAGPLSSSAYIDSLLKKTNSSSSSNNNNSRAGGGRSSSSSSSGGRYGSSSRTPSAAAATPAYTNAPAAAAAAAAAAGFEDDDEFADARGDIYNQIGPDYDSADVYDSPFDDSDDVNDSYHDPAASATRGYAASQLFAGSGSSGGGWVQGSGSSGPRRLSEMRFEARDLRIPLHGATGQEVARVLGGGVVPGSVVLVGGEPGKGKSTLLLQLAALVAQSCQTPQQQQLLQLLQREAAGSAGLSNAGSSRTPAAAAAPAAFEGQGEKDTGAGSDSEDDDVPLSQRRAAAAAAAAGSGRLVQSSRQRLPSSSSSSSSSEGDAEQRPGWLEDAAAQYAAAAAGVGASNGVAAGVEVPLHCLGRPVLYVTAEESEQQVWERAQRLGILDAMTGRSSSSSSSSSPTTAAAAVSPLDVQLFMQNDLLKILGAIAEMQPCAVVVDSIQTIADPRISAKPGGVTQVRECALSLVHMAKRIGAAVFLVGHVTKGGGLAGPKNLEHLVDVVLSLEAAGRGQLRLLRATKNRHGRQGEVGIFEMGATGLEAVSNAAALFAPSAITAGQDLLTDSSSSSNSGRLVGTAIAVIQDGVRPLPIEIQALVAPRLRVISNQPAAMTQDDGFVGSVAGGVGADSSSEEDGGYGNYSGGYSSSNSSSSEGDGAAADDDYDDGEDSSLFMSDITSDVIGSGSSDGGSSGSSSDLTGAGLMKGADRYVAAEAGVSPKEVLPLMRSVLGLPDRNRMGMLLELLTSYTPIKSHQYNMYINVVAGVTLPRGETMADLPVLAAVVSSVLSQPLPPATALMGECGLAGELRVGQQQLQLRVLELAKLGFEQVVIPSSAPNLGLSPTDLAGLRVVRCPTLRSALEFCFGAAALKRAGKAAVEQRRAAGSGGGQQQQQQQQYGHGSSGGSNGGSSGGYRAARRRSRTAGSS